MLKAEKLNVKELKYTGLVKKDNHKVKTHLTLVSTSVNCKTQRLKNPGLRRPKNNDVRSREYLTENEVKKIRDAARKTGRQGFRDSLIILMMYRHGLRLAELCDLKWDQVSFENGTIHINRLKNGLSSVQQLEGDEIRALRNLKRKNDSYKFIFVSEQKNPISKSSVQALVKRAGKVAGLDMPIHPHMLRHSTGYNLARIGATTRDIQAFLGHANIQNTVIYTQLSPNRFKSFGSKLGG